MSNNYCPHMIGECPELARLREELRAAESLHDLRWIDAQTAADLLGYSKRQFQMRIASRPDFPQPTAFGHPRWRLREVLAWMDAQRAPAPAAAA